MTQKTVEMEPVTKPDRQSLVLGTPHSKRRKLTRAHCPLISTHARTNTHIHTHAKCNIFNYKYSLESKKKKNKQTKASVPAALTALRSYYKILPIQFNGGKGKKGVGKGEKS